MELKKIATRESYGSALVELGTEYLMVLDADLAEATKTVKFKKGISREPHLNVKIGATE